MLVNEKFPTYKFNLSDTVYCVLTKENQKDLASYMKEENFYNLLIDGRFWEENYLNNMNQFDFLKELFVMWTKVDDLSPIQDIQSVEILTLDNGDKTNIDFSNFPNLKKIFSWKRSGIEKIWSVPTLKDLALGGLKRSDYIIGASLESFEKLRLVKTNVEDLMFLEETKNLKRLDLRGMSKLKNIEFLKKLTCLEYLFLEANQVRDFSVVNNLKGLRTCILKSKNAESCVDHFSQLKRLEKFALNGNENLRQVSREINGESYG